MTALQGPELIEKMKETVGVLKNRRAQMERRHQGWHAMQNSICSKWSRIEFRRAGAILFNLFEREFKSEKAVDVKLATDLITLREIYDVAVIVSGDQDYVPAVQAAKDSGKTVINVSFMARNGRVLPGGARRLNHLTDESIVVEYKMLGEYLRIKTTGRKK